eukprot:TRINITY_DN10779_c1_g1_i1.p1 TRINITY_DN10779_c1_g1~~TRINITY_DN10779_c1_g1_i1.p1  ORF type:complete len:164 (+),score=56.21 TRINITY_DN10779_c1_g1_i1:168-659(+)
MQLQAGKTQIEEQTRQALEILRQAAEEKKLQYSLNIEQELMQKEFSLDQQTSEQIMQLQQAAFQQRSQLEQQASALTLEYKQRQMQETMQMSLYDQKLKHYEQRQAVQQRVADTQKRREAIAAGSWQAQQQQQNAGAPAGAPQGFHGGEDHFAQQQPPVVYGH